MIPLRWIPIRAHTSTFKARISEAFRASYPVTMPRAMGLFFRQSPEKRKQNARKSVANRMGERFAAKLFL